jgi:hypothetical protein
MLADMGSADDLLRIRIRVEIWWVIALVLVQLVISAAVYVYTREHELGGAGVIVSLVPILFLSARNGRRLEAQVVRWRQFTYLSRRYAKVRALPPSELETPEQWTEIEALWRRWETHPEQQRHQDTSLRSDR